MTEGRINKRYLGDGLYAEIDNERQVWVSTDRGDTLPRRTEEIAIEPMTMNALVQYMRDTIEKGGAGWPISPLCPLCGRLQLNAQGSTRALAEAPQIDSADARQALDDLERDRKGTQDGQE